MVNSIKKKRNNLKKKLSLKKPRLSNKVNKKVSKHKGGSKKIIRSKRNLSKKKFSKKKFNVNLKGGSKKKKSKKNSKKKKSKKNSRKKNSSKKNKKGGNIFKGVVQALQQFEHQDDEGKNKKFNNKICSPHLNNTQFTCFSHDSLKKIAKAYNKNYENKKEFSINHKEKLWEQIKDSLKQQCGENEVCWKNQDFVQQLNDNEIEEFTFKPKIPKKKYEWLKTSDINKVLVQFQKKHNDFLFLGTVPIDFDELFKEFKKIKVDQLMNNNINKLGVVFNLDPHWKGGSHWVCMFADLPHSVEYFDSYGDDNDDDGKPPKEIKTFMDRISGQIEKSGGGNKSIQKYNTIRHQYANSECGVYCLNYIIERLSGRSFEDITGSITKDEEMNQNRKIYFRE